MPCKETSGKQASAIAIAVNIILAIVKIMTGILGNSYALIADGIESTVDIISSLIVWSGLQIAAKPPDDNHPYGHGKAESIAAMMVSLFLLCTAVFIAIQSIHEILRPHQMPEWYTLLVLFIVIVIKEILYRYMFYVGTSIESSSLKSDAWHHRSDALTSLAAFIGITVALLGGRGYESADDWAAVLACGFIIYNGVKLFILALDEVMDAAVENEVEITIRQMAKEVKGVVDIEKCRIRKSGLGLLMDIHVVVAHNITVLEGHQIGHDVKNHLCQSSLNIHDVVVHVEPDVAI